MNKEEKIMKLETKINNINLTTIELGGLWSSYSFVSTVHHILSYFEKNIEDKVIKQMVITSNAAAREHVNTYVCFFKKENIPLPRGTVSEDINVSAPTLFSDIFCINYIKAMVKSALQAFGLAYTESVRDDIREMFKKHLNDVQELDRVATEVMILKGIYVNKPYIQVPSQIDFVEDKSFFTGFFGDKRPLTVLEINQLFMNIQTNALGSALMLGFSMSTKSEEIQQYVLKGKAFADKYIEMFSQKLKNEGIMVPPSFENQVLSFKSNEVPFSDRLILNHTVFLNTYAIGTYGLSISQSLRNDLKTMYAKIILGVIKYTNDGADILIRNKWFEQPPTAQRQKQN